MKTYCYVGILFLALVEVQSVCNPDILEIKHFRECYPESVIKIQNFTGYIDNKCLLRLKGCLRITSPYSSAKGKTEIKVNGMKMPIRNDLCKDLANPQKTAGKVGSVLGLHCPEKARIVCADEKKFIDFWSNFEKMGVSGDVAVKMEVNHGNGKKTCIESLFNIKK